ncbi:MAG: hypothetical protein Fur0016_04710 [Anaerolineales bacterium]
MNPNQAAAYQSLQQAQQALKAGDRTTARHFAEQAVRATPELEEVWLMMAALASPQASVGYLQRALQINPTSERAQKGMVWAMARLNKVSTPLDHQAAAPPGKAPPARPVETRQAASVAERTQPTRPVPSPIEAQTGKKPATPLPASRPKALPTTPTGSAQKSHKRRRIPILPLLALLLCAVIGGVVWWSATPVAAFLRSEAGGPDWAQAETAELTLTPSPEPTTTVTATPSLTATQTATSTFTSTPSLSPSPTITETPPASHTPLPSETPSITPTEEATPTPLPTDTAMPTRVVPTRAVPPQAQNPGAGGGERWIDVDLSQQMLYAYEGNTLVNSFVVSTGTWQYPTVTGQYRIYIKYRYKDMSGPGYYLKNVPYTMFFYKGYAIHGTYWHNNFGTPMSHGCVNLTIADAEWVYNFASVGTLVNVHY